MSRYTGLRYCNGPTVRVFWRAGQVEQSNEPSGLAGVGTPPACCAYGPHCVRPDTARCMWLRSRIQVDCSANARGRWGGARPRCVVQIARRCTAVRRIAD
eukprot:7958051-Lingulodinium_polyedra.AAC.1